MIGGVCINTGTIPSKTLREAVLYLTGLSQRELYGSSYRVKEDITVGDLAARTQHVIGREIDVIRNQLARNRVALLTGTGRFADPHTMLHHRRHGPRVARSPPTRSSSPPAPGRPARTASTSTTGPSSTPTASSTSSACRARWSWSAPA